MMNIKTALLSVSDKTGIIEFAQALVSQGIQLISTGGTAHLLKAAGLKVMEVRDYIQSPEILDGRVKTLHPKIHGGLLAKRDNAQHMATLATYGIEAIDLLVVNLYPFCETISQADCTFAHAIENIDIGGPAMLRAAAKNHGTAAGSGVTVVVDPTDYPSVLAEIAQSGHISYARRLELATKVFATTAAYDGAIAAYLSSLRTPTPEPDAIAERDAWPKVLTLQLHHQKTLRYGENPHQDAAFYVDHPHDNGLLSHYHQIQGKALSYNNIADADAAWECVKSFDTPACVIVKHANPCGVAVAGDALTAYQKALNTDPTSAFGGIIAFNCPVNAVTAKEVSTQFLEVLLAPGYSAEALAVLTQKMNVRVLEIPAGSSVNRFDSKRVGGGWLLQSPDINADVERESLRVVTHLQPTSQQIDDLLFAWKVAKYVKSNAIVFAHEGRTLAIGAGQMSRLDSARIASIKANHAGLSLQHSVVASDAFFPFRDGVDVIADATASCIIQPGGSMRDQEVIAAANEHGLVMVFTGIRHFRH